MVRRLWGFLNRFLDSPSQLQKQRHLGSGWNSMPLPINSTHVLCLSLSLQCLLNLLMQKSSSTNCCLYLQIQQPENLTWDAMGFDPEVLLVFLMYPMLNWYRWGFANTVFWNLKCHPASWPYGYRFLIFPPYHLIGNPWGMVWIVGSWRWYIVKVKLLVICQFYWVSHR